MFIIKYCQVPQQSAPSGVPWCIEICLGRNHKIRFLNAHCFYVHYLINHFYFVLYVILLQNTKKALNKWNCICLIPKIWVIQGLWLEYIYLCEEGFSSLLSPINSDCYFSTDNTLKIGLLEKSSRLEWQNQRTSRNHFLPSKNQISSAGHVTQKAKGRNCVSRRKKIYPQQAHTFLSGITCFVNLDLVDHKTLICVEWIF